MWDLEDIELNKQDTEEGKSGEASLSEPREAKSAFLPLVW